MQTNHIDFGQKQKPLIPAQQFQLQLFEAAQDYFHLNSLSETTEHLTVTFAEYINNSKENGVSKQALYVEYLRQADILNFMVKAHTLFCNFESTKGGVQ